MSNIPTFYGLCRLTVIAIYVISVLSRTNSRFVRGLAKIFSVDRIVSTAARCPNNAFRVGNDGFARHSCQTLEMRRKAMNARTRCERVDVPWKLCARTCRRIHRDIYVLTFSLKRDESGRLLSRDDRIREWTKRALSSVFNVQFIILRFSDVVWKKKKKTRIKNKLRILFSTVVRPFVILHTHICTYIRVALILEL